MRRWVAVIAGIEIKERKNIKQLIDSGCGKMGQM